MTRTAGARRPASRHAVGQARRSLAASFTNAVAFSPTDVMSLTRRVKMMMLAEAAVSAMTTLLVAARAVNILR